MAEYNNYYKELKLFFYMRKNLVKFMGEDINLNCLPSLIKVIKQSKEIKIKSENNSDKIDVRELTVHVPKGASSVRDFSYLIRDFAGKKEIYSGLYSLEKGNLFEEDLDSSSFLVYQNLPN